MTRMLEPRATAVVDSAQDVESLPSATTSATRSIARRCDGEVSELVESLRLAQLGVRRSAAATHLAWISALAVVAIGGWYGYSHFARATPVNGYAFAPSVEAMR